MTTKKQKYKIQISTLWGWADLKASEDGHDYKTESFDSIKEAMDEINQMVEFLNEKEELHRVVVFEEPEDVNLYA